MEHRQFNVLFLCTGNTARSVMAEGILRKDGAGRFNSFSAGSQPKGVINPFALKVLGSFGYPMDGYRSKSWDSPRRTRQRWILFSPSATAQRAKPVRCGQATP